MWVVLILSAEWNTYLKSCITSQALNSQKKKSSKGIKINPLNSASY